MQQKVEQIVEFVLVEYSQESRGNDQRKLSKNSTLINFTSVSESLKLLPNPRKKLKRSYVIKRLVAEAAT